MPEQRGFNNSKYVSKWNAPAMTVWYGLWQYYGSCICHHVQLFPWLPDICLACYGHMSLRFCSIFNGLCVSQKVFLHLQTVSYRMTVVGFFFLTHFLTRFPTIFTEVNDWLYVWNYVGLMSYVYIVWKILDVANQN